MKQNIKKLTEKALEALQIQGLLPSEFSQKVQIEHTRDKQFGDFACNIAMLLTKVAKLPPRELAEKIISALPESENIEKVEIAGPGFINFYLTSTALHNVISEVIKSGVDYGHSEYGGGRKINFEFVSANPTGPLHVGHGRSVAFGAACTNLLDAVGYNVHREYYVNDAGRQMNILAASIWLRYLELCNEQFKFPVNGYKGDYIVDIAKQVKDEHGDALHWPSAKVFTDIPADEDEAGNGDKEAHIDGLIERAKALLGESGYESVFNAGLNTIVDDIREDLEQFGLSYQEWFSEQQLYHSNAIWKYIDQLKASGHTYERNGNLWFRSTDFNDDKDRVIIRQDGRPTYFAADIAYHTEKFTRGADEIIVILGADHHGYVTRVKAALQALGIDLNKVKVLIVQFATLYRGSEKVQMSTRSGSFVTLRELREEVGKDAARFFYVLRKAEQHLDFDLELAKSQSSDNPVYYIQYAHARIASVFRQCGEKNITWDQQDGLNQLELLLEQHEAALIDDLTRYPEIVQNSALNHEPHLLAHFLRDLANDFHTYYNAHQFLVDNENLRNARLCLITAVKQTLANGLTLLGVDAPDTM